MTPPNQSPSVKGDITYGANDGLKVLLNTLTDANLTMLKYLAGQVSDCQGSPSITVTGHSLGGALSPAVALVLLDSQGAPLSQPNGWDPASKSHLSVVPSAGPTPGNEIGRDYYDGRIGKTTDRLWNAIDIVPHAWQISMLKEIPAIYQPQFPISDFVKAAVSIADGNSTVFATLSRSGARQIRPSVPGLPGKVNPSIEVTARDLIAILDTLLANDLIGKLGKELKLSAIEVVLIKAAIDDIIEYLNRETDAHERMTSAALEGVRSSHLSALRARNGDVEGWLRDLLDFLVQVAFQHTTAYDELLGTTVFSGIVEAIKDETPFPPPHLA